MDLLRLDRAGLAFGTQVLLDDVELTLRRGERLGLLGRNGAGKTTLLKVLAGDIDLDSGERWVRPGIRIARLEQTLRLKKAYQKESQKRYTCPGKDLEDTHQVSTV